MYRMTLVLLLTGWVGVCTAVAGNALADGGFEDPASWQAYHHSVTVQPDTASTWWVGGDTAGWGHQQSYYPHTGLSCAGDNDGVGISAGLVQFVPAGGTHTSVSVGFHYLLWKGEGESSLTYAVFGWDEGDVIDLSETGPGADGDLLVGPTTLDEPVYRYDPWPPADGYQEQQETATFGPGQYDYIGVWFQYELDGSSFYLDDVSVTTTPEPTSLALLGFAGIALLRRRKR